MRAFDLVFAYFSPETLLPVTSIVATIAGVVVMLGKGSIQWFMRVAQRRFRRSVRVAGTSRPHGHLAKGVPSYSRPELRSTVSTRFGRRSNRDVQENPE